jgi:hypothetical protein
MLILILTYRALSKDLLLAVLCLFTLAPGPAFASTSQIGLFVSESMGSDANTGTTAASPLKTLAHAISIAMQARALGTSAVITMSPGVYREAVSLNGIPGQTASITIQSDNTGQVVISGSDQWGQWQPLPTNPNIFFHSWPYDWGTCTVPAGWPTITPLGLRRELAFVESLPMVQVLTPEAMQEGTYFVNENSGQILLWPQSGVDMSTADVEIGIRPTILRTQNISNLTLQGLIFEHATSCISTTPSGAVEISAGNNINISNTIFRWNNWMGLQLFSLTDFQVENATSTDNGELGIDGYRLEDGLFSNVELSHNDWRSEMGGLEAWEPSGGKFVETHRVSFQNIQAISNAGRGLWFDTDNSSIVISNSVIANNVSGGLDVEASMGPVLVEDSTLCGDLTNGIQGNSAEQVTLLNNQIFGNQKSQIQVLVSPVPRVAVNWETGLTFSAISQFWTMSQNIIAGTQASQLLYQDVLDAGDRGAGPFLTTLVSNYNKWYQPNVALPFHFFLPASGVSPPPEHEATLEGWRTRTQTDNYSTVTAPAAGLSCPSGED